MHARISRMKVSADKIDELTEGFQQRDLDNLKGQSGFKGATLMGDRSSGEVIGITYWESEGDLSSSEQAGEEARTHAAEAGEAGREPEVSRYEVTFDEMV
jgi:heme-degrading monooxygenase HmoA